MIDEKFFSYELIKDELEYNTKILKIVFKKIIGNDFECVSFL